MSGYPYCRPDIARSLCDALRDDPFYATLERTIKACPGHEGMVRYMDFSMCEAERYGELVLHEGPEGRTCGASVWSRPLGDAAGRDMKRRKREFLSEQLGMSSLEAYNAIVGFMSGQSAPLVAQDAWYLSIVGIAPAFQGRGLGPGLITRVLARTDGLGADTYLETFTPRNIPFYERLGYVIADVIREPTTRAEYAIMVRPARPA